MLRPASMNHEDNAAVMHSTDASVTSDFKKAYQYHMVAMQVVAECAKVYLIDNWEKVKNWTDLEIVMVDANTLKGFLNSANGGEPLDDYVEYFNYTGEAKAKAERMRASKNTRIMADYHEERDERDKLKHNPVKEISDVVLDTTDGDFSLTINGRVHMWISDETVIVLANYVEKQLKEQDEKI